MRNPPTLANFKIPKLTVEPVVNKENEELVKIQLDGVADVFAQYTAG